MDSKILLNKVPYYLPLTQIRIHGTRTTTQPIDSSETATANVQVDLVTGADLSHPRYIVEADNLLADRQLTVESTESGLLAGTNATSSGKLGSIIQNIFGSVLRFGLFFASPLGLLSDEAAQPAEASGAEDAYQKRFPGLGAARQAAKESVAALTKAIADQSKELPTIDDPNELDARCAKLEKLAKALLRLKSEAEALEKHFNAWKAGEERSVVTSRDYTASLEDLPEEEKIGALQRMTEAEIKRQLKAESKGSLGDLFWDLRMVVADAKVLPQLSDVPEHKGNPPFEGREDARGVEFRLPRPTALSLFEIRKDEGADTYSAVPQERRLVSVHDQNCISALLRIKGSAWSDKSLDIDFSANGSVVKITTDAKSELAAFADTLSKLPPEVLQSLKDSNAFVDERQKLALQSIEHRIEELKKEKELVQGRIALAETLATQEQAAKLAQIDQEIMLLQKQIQLQQLAGGADSQIQTKLAGIEADLVKARTALEQAEIERLKVQSELNKAQGEGEEP